ncbi:MAG: PQQ-binding-like beta-propeller repeat protein [Planctomycetota bacterium]|nr:PQQ-binding-like beta-propeller repeat protein [Planctomycetota bacterium]
MDRRPVANPLRPASGSVPGRAALWTGVVTSVASAFVAAVLVAAAVLDDRTEVLDAAALESLRRRLEREPNDEQLKSEIRLLDRRVREGFFRRRRMTAAGALLLLGGGIAALMCLKWYVFVPGRLFKPEVRKRQAGDVGESIAAERRRAFQAVCVAGGTIAAVLVVLAIFRPPPGAGYSDADQEQEDGIKGRRKAEKSDRTGGAGSGNGSETEPLKLRPRPAGDGAAAGGLEAGAAVGGPEDNWPRFRGPYGTGIVPGKRGPWPHRWDVKTGANIVWVAELEAPGKSSPIVWGNRVFVTGADKRRQLVMCFDASSGRRLWAVPVTADAPWKRGRGAEIEVFEDTGFAAPTPATDGRRICAAFASGDLVCLDFAGKVLWAVNRGRPESAYGLASSPVVAGSSVIWQLDQGGSAEDGLSKLIAFDIATGKVLWGTPRPVPNSWSTPIIAGLGKRLEVVTVADPWVISYDLESGSELWRANVMHGDVAPSPVFADGVVYVTGDGARVAAIKAGGLGDVSETHVLWTASDGMPDASSPLCDGRLFLQASGGGRITCYDAAAGAVADGKPAEGKLLWARDLGDCFWASPSLAGGKVYLPGKSGKVYVFEWSDKGYVETAVSDMGEPVEASPAFSKDRIYIRTARRLYCIGEKEAAGRR